jgi:hypothetical protein
MLFGGDEEVSSAAAIHPDAFAIEAPGLALNAGRLAALVDQANALGCIDGAIVSPHVVGRAGHLASVLGSHSALCLQTSCAQEKNDDRAEKKRTKPEFLTGRFRKEGPGAGADFIST